MTEFFNPQCYTCNVKLKPKNIKPPKGGTGETNTYKSILFTDKCPEPLEINNTQYSKLFICSSKEEHNLIIQSAEILMLEYRVVKKNENLWHINIILK
jgi:hypothetical protein